MSNYKQSIDGHTLIPFHPLHFSSECLHKKKNHGARKLPVSNRNTTDLSSLDKTSYDAQSQVSPELNHFFSSTNQRRSLQNPRLIPLKLGSAAKIPDNTITCEKPTPSSAIQRKLLTASTSNNCKLPISEEECKSALAEVKILYLKGNHKRCAMRCRLLLERTKDSIYIDPAYRVYLASYLASSLEIIAFTLPNNSSPKLPLYQEALTLYQSAISELDYAIFCADSLVCSSNTSVSPSQLSSARSSVDSVFSQYSETSSIASASPSCKESSLNSIMKELVGSESRRKKVSFSLPPHDSSKSPLEHDDSAETIPFSFLDSFPMPTLQTETVRKRLSLEPAPLNLSGVRSLSPLSKIKSPNSSKLSYLKSYKNILLGFQSQFDSRIKEIKTTIDEITRFPRNIQEVEESNSKTSNLRTIRLEVIRPRKRFDGSRYQILCKKALDEL